MTIDLLRRHWQRIAAGGAAALGAVFLFVGWWGVSGADLTTEQIPFLASGALGGVFALGIGATLWLSADLRDEYLKLEDIHQVVRHLTDTTSGGRPASDLDTQTAPMNSTDSGSEPTARLTDDADKGSNGRRPLRPPTRQPSRR